MEKKRSSSRSRAKSPGRVEAKPRSRSSGRKPISRVMPRNVQGGSPSVEKERSKSKSPRRVEATARSRSSGRKPVPVTKLEGSPVRSKSKSRAKSKDRIKKASPSRSKIRDKSSEESPIKTRIKKKIQDIRDSITPDRKMIEDTVRASLSRLDEATTEVIRRVTRSRARETSPPKKKANVDVIYVSENNTNNYKPLSDSSKPKKEYSNLIILPFLLYPLILIGFHFICTKGNCPLVPQKITFNWKKLFDVQTSYFYIGFLFIQSLISLLPLGPKYNGLPDVAGKVVSYRCNSFSTLLITFGTLYGLHRFLKFDPVLLLDKTIPLISISLVTAFLLSIIVYIKGRNSKNRNPYANTGDIAYDFCFGSEINPSIGPIDIKTTLFRTCFTVTALQLTLLILKQVKDNGIENFYLNSVIVVALLQLIYVLSIVLLEANLLTTFAIQREGTGFFFITHISIFPFWFTLIPKYLSYVPLTTNVWLIGGAVVLHTLGLIIATVSSYKKAQYKRNPRIFRSVTDVVIDVKSNLHLYKGSLWSKVRHPNYTGVLLCFLSYGIIGSLAGPFHWITVLVPFCALAETLAHISRIETRCHTDTHPTSWTRYTYLVPNKLIPHIY